MRRDRLIARTGVLLMLGAGLAFALGAVATLDLGSARRMGPGAFPALVGGLLAALAALSLAAEWRRPLGWERPDPVAAVSVAGGTAVFALVTPLLGVLPAAALSVLATASGVRACPWRWRVALACGVAGGVWLVFVQGLGIPLPVLRWP